MPDFEITDNETGKVVVVTGDSAPTEQDAEGIFEQAGLRGVEQPVGEVQGPEQEEGLRFRGATFTREAAPGGFLGLGKGGPLREDIEEFGAGVKKRGKRLVGAVEKGATPEKFVQLGQTIINGLSPFEDPETGERPIVEAGNLVLKLGAGTVELAIPGEQGEEQFARAFGQFIADKYGGDTPEEIRENWLAAIEENSFEVASDFGGFVSAFGGFLRLTSLGGKVKLLNETGKIFTDAGARLDPIAGLTGIVGRAAQKRKSINTLVKSAVNFSVDPKLTPVQRLAKTDQLATEFLTATGPKKTILSEGLRVNRASLNKLQKDINKVRSKVNNIIEVKTSQGILIKTDDIVKGLDDIIEDMDKFGLGGVEEIANTKKLVQLRKQFLDAKGEFMTPNEVQKLKKGLNLGFAANVQTEFSQVIKTVNDRIRAVAKTELEKIHPQLKILNAKDGVMIELSNAIANRLVEIERKPIVKTLGLVSAGVATGAVGGISGAGLAQSIGFGLTAAVAGAILTSPNVQIKVARALAVANMKAARAGKLGVLSRSGFQAGRLEDIPGMSNEDIQVELGLPAAKVIPQQLRTLR